MRTLIKDSSDSSDSDMDIDSDSESDSDSDRVSPLFHLWLGYMMV